MLPTALITFISSAVLAFAAPQKHLSETPTLAFQLRHIHGVSPDNTIVFADVDRSVSIASTGALRARTRNVSVHRPKSQEAFHRARHRSARDHESTLLGWDEDEIMGPDVEDKETVLMLAQMTSNAYLNPGEKGWYEVGEHWNVSFPFGWEPDADGFRGHVFATEDNSTVILSIKGTSGPWIAGGGGPTYKKDKLNDNLLFSCCCARVDWTWSTVCGCYGGGWKCDQNCVDDALQEESLFYPIGINLYNNLTYLYPNSTIWMSGHSLGGALASLLGVTFGVPVVAFESPGEKMAAERLHLPSAPSHEHITHFYHTADPIPMGACTGVLSSCSLAGYALESRCHLGKSAVYDTVNKLGWSVDVRTHGINVVIDKILSIEWNEDGRDIPEATWEEDCVECYSWEYGNFKNKTVPPDTKSFATALLVTP